MSQAKDAGRFEAGLTKTAPAAKADPVVAAQELAQRAELVERMTTLLPQEGYCTPFDSFALFRRDTTPDAFFSIFDPGFCVIVQGQKHVVTGDREYVYDPFHYLLATVAVPSACRPVVAAPDEPFLSLIMQFDPALVGAMLVEAGDLAGRAEANDASAFTVGELEPALLDAVVRLIRLADRPEEARVMLPLLMKEIVFRLIAAGQGSRLHHLAVVGGQRHQLSEAVSWLQEHYSEPLRVPELAQRCGMSVSSFHAHFKSITAMSPLQYQKRLRLQEARRLLVSEDLDAASAGYRVGYEDASQFSREYRRLFGLPPARDAARLVAGDL